MDYQRNFVRWLDSEEGEQFWDSDEHGERVILRSGWDRALAEYNRIQESLAANLEKDLKE